MELVKGVPITQYCNQHHLTPRQRLELFVSVCHAVQHAHQKGIIHRDLKPSNVLVSRHDTTPVVKVIDFGVAKALGAELTDLTLLTGIAQMVGTPLYMSPEQAGMSDLDVDTRSDIYSLGVLLYELLTGMTPFCKERFQQVAYDEIRRIIREEEPPKPSTRLSDSRDTLPSFSAQRQTEPAKLTKLVRGELDWIVMKALDKDRNRRYESANGFAADVQRYLADEPVQACPPSVGYRFRKFARRHRGPVAAAAVVFVAVLAGTGVATWQAVRASQAQKLATERLLEVSKEKERATIAETTAKEEAAIAKAVNDFLLNDLLAEAAPDKHARAKKVTVEEILGRASARIADKFDQQPRIEAAIRMTIGDTYHALGDYPAAQPHLERALEVRRRVLGEEHPETLTSMHNLALLYRSQGQFAKVGPLLVKSLEVSRRVLGEEHPNTLGFMNALAGLYGDKAQYTKAEPLLVNVLEVARRVLGEEQPETVSAMNNLARLYKFQGNYLKAEPLYVKALEVRLRVLGEEDPNTLTTMHNLAGLYLDQAQYPKAAPLFVKTLEVRSRILGEEHPHTLLSMHALASLYKLQTQFAKAEPLYVKALEVRRRVLGEEHPDTLISMKHLAELYEVQGQYAKAEPFYREALENTRKRHGEASPSVAGALGSLGLNLLKQQNHAKSEPVLRECLKICARENPEHWTTFHTQSILGASLLGQKKYAEAEPLLLAGYAGMKQREAKIPAQYTADLTEALERLVHLYEATGKKDEAGKWRKQMETQKVPDGKTEQPKRP